VEAAPPEVRATWSAWRPDGFSEVAQALAEAAQSGARVRDIVRSLKRFVSAPPSAVEASLRRVVEQALENAREALRRCAEVEVRIPEELAARADEATLVEVLTAIVSNAAEATGAAPNRLRISAEPLPDRGAVAVSVADAGTGIAPDALPHLFEPFFSTKAALGRGLGLFFCLGEVRALGGEMEVDSTLGSGTTVRVILPASSAVAPGDPR